jgi:hypothetical protein
VDCPPHLSPQAGLQEKVTFAQMGGKLSGDALYGPLFRLPAAALLLALALAAAVLYHQVYHHHHLLGG